ncbi:hypothetical protein LCGC14_2185140, partial [marine sediment metagenome]
IWAGAADWRVTIDGRLYLYTAAEWRRYHEIALGRVPVAQIQQWYDPEGFFNPGGTVVWAAFLTRKQARLWLPYFERKFKRRIENGDTFEVVRCPASLHRVYVDTADPDQENWVH